LAKKIAQYQIDLDVLAQLKGSISNKLAEVGEKSKETLKKLEESSFNTFKNIAKNVAIAEGAIKKYDSTLEAASKKVEQIYFNTYTGKRITRQIPAPGTSDLLNQVIPSAKGLQNRIFGGIPSTTDIEAGGVVLDKVNKIISKIREAGSQLKITKELIKEVGAQAKTATGGAKQELDLLLKSLKAYEGTLINIQHGGNKGFRDLRSFFGDIKDLALWQMRWYGAKALLFKPMEMGGQFLEEGFKYAKDLDKKKAYLLRYPAMEGPVTEGDRANVDAMMKQIRALAVSYGLATDEIYKSADRLYAAGMKYSTIMASLSTFAKLQITYPEIEMDKFTTAIVGFLNVFRDTPGLKELESDSKRLEVIIDKITFALAKGVINPKDITSVIQYMGQAGAMAGFTLDQLLAISVVVTNFGDKANRGARSFRGMLDSLQSEKVLKFLDDVGIKLDKNKTLGDQFFSLMEQLRQKAGVNQGEGVSLNIASLLRKAASTERAKPLQVFLTALEELQQLTQDIGEKGLGSLDRSFKEVENTPERLTEKLKMLSKEIFASSWNSELFRDTLKLLIGTVQSLGAAFAGVIFTVRVLWDAIVQLVDIIGTLLIKKPGTTIIDNILEAWEKIKILASDKSILKRGEELTDTLNILYGVTTPAKDADDAKKKILDKLNASLKDPGKQDKKTYSKRESSQLKKDTEEEIKAITNKEKRINTILESFHKLGLVGDMQYNEAKLQNAVKHLDEKIAIEQVYFDKYVENGEIYEQYLADKQRLIKNKASQESLDILKRDFDNNKKEAENRLDELKRLKFEATINGEDAITLLLRNIIKERSDFEVNEEVKKQKTLLNIKQIMREKEDELNKWLYDKGLMSAEAYYTAKTNMLSQELNDELKLIKDERDKEIQLQNNIINKAGGWTFEGGIENQTQEVRNAYYAQTSAIETANRATEEAMAKHSKKVQALDLERKDSIKAIYGSSGVSGVIGKAFEDLNTEWSNTGQHIYDTTKNIVTNMENSFADFFDYMSEGFMDFENLAKNVLHTIYMELLKNILLKQVLSGLFGGTGGLGSAIAGLFSGGGSSGGGVNSGAFASFGEGFSFLQKAGGGSVSLNTPYIVGESGPELFVPNASGNIIPNNRLGTSSAPTLIVNVENKTGKQVKATQSQPQFDGKKWVRTVMLELADQDMAVRSRYSVR
jgi:TP901 family phage tail tape measure protein